MLFSRIQCNKFSDSLINIPFPNRFYLQRTAIRAGQFTNNGVSGAVSVFTVKLSFPNVGKCL